MGLVTILAKIVDDTGGAGRIARLAGVAPVQDQPVMRVLQELWRHDLQELILHRPWSLTCDQTDAVGDAEYVGVHRDGGLPERRIQNDVGSFSADARQAFEFFAR